MKKCETSEESQQSLLAYTWLQFFKPDTTVRAGSTGSALGHDQMRTPKRALKDGPLSGDEQVKMSRTLEDQPEGSAGTLEPTEEDNVACRLRQEDETQVVSQKQLSTVRHQVQEHSQFLQCHNLRSNAALLAGQLATVTNRNTKATSTPREISATHQLEDIAEVTSNDIRNWCNVRSSGAAILSSDELGMKELDNKRTIKSAVQAEIRSGRLHGPVL